jgi:hypothetical protein
MDIISHKWALPREDVNAPDLYIPLMSFISYVLLIGVHQGVYNDANFSPEILVTAVYRCLLLQLTESAIIMIGLSIMSVSLPFLDIYSYTGYKYYGLCMNIVSKVFGSIFHILCSLYVSIMLGYFVLRSMGSVVPAATTGPPRHLMLLGFAATQFVVMLILCML